MESSMLQYSERMRIISTARVCLGDGLEALERMGTRDNENREKGWSSRNGAFMERRNLQRPEYCQFKVKDRNEDDCLPPLGPVTNKPRRQRPLSFDEKELQHNINVVKTRRRPYSFDEKELQRNEAINAQHRQRQQREAFTKPARPIVIPTSDAVEDSHSAPGDGEVRISFVNASDLYELVDIKRQIKRNQNANSLDGTVKLTNVPGAVQFLQDIEPKKERNIGELRGNSLSLQSGPDSVDTKNPLKRDRRVKTNVNLNTELLGKKDCNTAKKNNSVRPETDIERVTPMGIFLQQAVSDFATQNALNIRPKRAKRMSLRKPRLLDIPEDADSTLQPECEARLEPAPRRVRHPTDTSLQAIKEVKEIKQEDNGVGAASLENGRITQRPRYGEDVKGTEGPLPSSKSSTRKHKHKHTNKLSQPNLDIDKLLMTSIYPTLPWDTETVRDQPSSRNVILPEKSSHKEKAHRKMKKLIFLRDRPDQHYRRDT